jgi:hypothetical protein
LKLSANVQVWIPIELLVAVESLWENSDLKDLITNVPKDSTTNKEQQQQDKNHHQNGANSNMNGTNSESSDNNAKYYFEEERVLTWLIFVTLVHGTTPNSLSTHNSSDSLSPASRLYLLRLGYAKLMTSLRGNNIHTATRNHPKQSELLRAFYQVQQELSSDIESSNLPYKNNKSALLSMAM